MNLDHINRPLVYYHKNCTDGWCSAWLAHQRWSDAELIAVDYGDVHKDLSIVQRCAGRHVLVVDFSFPREDLLGIKEIAASILVLDHHVTARDALSGLDFCVFDMDRSGAGLCLDHFFPGPRELQEFSLYRDSISWSRHFLATRVEDTDLWRFSFRESKAVRAALTTVPKDVEAWDSLDVYSLESKGSSILAYQDAMIERICESAYEIEWPEGKLLVANTQVLQSEVGNALSDRAPSPLRTVLLWHRAEDGSIRCSLRSHKDGADVSALAKARGGGGHAHAAGFRAAGWDVVVGIQRTV